MYIYIYIKYQQIPRNTHIYQTYIYIYIYMYIYHNPRQRTLNKLNLGIYGIFAAFEESYSNTRVVCREYIPPT
jgi:hypothetical protein